VTPAERVANITECAARVLAKPQATVVTVCSFCQQASGELLVSADQAGLRFDRMHVACVPRYRARLSGKPTVAA
jgi:hypothetical protein